MTPESERRRENSTRFPSLRDIDFQIASSPRKTWKNCDGVTCIAIFQNSRALTNFSTNCLQILSDPTLLFGHGFWFLGAGLLSWKAEFKFWRPHGAKNS